MVIPADLPALVAPVAWMLGTWEGWGMHANPAAPGQEASAEAPADSPVILRYQARWCCLAHARVTVPENMARMVPLVQMAGDNR